MTLTEYETALVPLPGFQRFPAAGAATKLRELVARGHGFTAARDAIVGQRQYYDRLRDGGQLSSFSTLSGP